MLKDGMSLDNRYLGISTFQISNSQDSNVLFAKFGTYNGR